MTYKIVFSLGAEKKLAAIKKCNPQMWRKLQKILGELMEHPRNGTGHPEPLKGGSSVTYSRRLSAKDRIVYDIYDDTIVVLVVTIGGHYGDK